MNTELSRPVNAGLSVTAVWWRPVALGLFSLLLGVLLSEHSLWRDEAQAWQIASYAESTSALFRSLGYEGHPALWYLLLRVVHSLFQSPLSMRVVHWVIASLNAFLILWYCPLPPWQRVCCCFGYFVMFEYGVISRGYALELFIALWFVTLRTIRPASILGPALLLALLIHTSIPGIFLALSLAAGWAIESLNVERLSNWRVIVAAAIIGGSLVTAAIYMQPPADSSFAQIYEEYRHNLTLAEALANTRIFLRVIVPVPALNTLHFWNDNITEHVNPKGLRLAVQYPGTLLVLGLAGLCFVRRASVFLAFVMGTVLIAGFAIAHGQLAMRHQGQWFVLVFLCFWLISRDQGSHRARTVDRLARITSDFQAFAFAAQPVALILVLYYIFRIPFSTTSEIVQAVKIQPRSRCNWIAYPEASVAPISLLLGHEVYSVQQNRFERFSLWKGLSTVSQDAPELRSAAKSLESCLNAPGDSVLLFLNQSDVRPIMSEMPHEFSARELMRLPEGIVEGETNSAFIITRSPGTTKSRE
jgi:hypothetical protein